jgi:hypothetical protein
MGYYLEEHPNPNTAQYGWPRTWCSGVIGIHTTESGVIPAGADPGAENTAGFISRRSDYGSYHMIADWDTIVPMTRPTFAAWADTTNNVHALSVSGAMDAARWRDITPERAAGIVRNMGIAAAMLAHDAVAHGVLKQVPPARRITAQQAIDGTAAGFYGHGETNPGTRYDPGQNFDWELFLASYAAAVGGSITYQSTTSEGDIFMALTDEQQARILAAADRINGVITDPNAKVLTEAHLPDVAAHVLNKTIPRGGAGAGLGDGLTSLGAMVAWNDDHTIQLLAAAAATAAQEGGTVDEIKAAVVEALKENVVKVEVSVEGSSGE